ncbi:cell division protein FtsY [candidate division MSBL1 archaeon SCGC-AAA261F17]|uniref:Signal recognition particle receptor FtsY n=1 Tax=candidate division MSBL1 archaeon SCGC-AAA261F17 TaxID=1698274 RepID=A0A133V7F8_9EURY|nr:cell division protein FtsY [candidate division MSBL1 archaeon SCGC-AAA261F17]
MLENLKQKFKRVTKRITRRGLTPEDIKDISWDLKVELLESDVAVPVADEIIDRLQEEVTGEKLGLREDAEESAREILRGTIGDILTPEREVEILETIKKKQDSGAPAVLLFVGVNGCGKTTTIAKLTKYLQDKGYKPVLAAADTFRAAGIEQLEKHGKKLGVRVIKHERGADAAAVAYDAIEHAKAQNLDAVLIDTAGRMQSNVNLMDEMSKISKVTNPDLTIFVGDALTGNDAIEQAKKFNDAVKIDGSILCKMDADARGGATLSVTKITGSPILFLGTGQDYDDLVEFKPEIILDAIFPEET